MHLTTCPCPSVEDRGDFIAYSDLFKQETQRNSPKPHSFEDFSQAFYHPCAKVGQTLVRLILTRVQ